MKNHENDSEAPQKRSKNPIWDYLNSLGPVLAFDIVWNQFSRFPGKWVQKISKLWYVTSLQNSNFPLQLLLKKNILTCKSILEVK